MKALLDWGKFAKFMQCMSLFSVQCPVRNPVSILSLGLLIDSPSDSSSFQIPMPLSVSVLEASTNQR